MPDKSQKIPGLVSGALPSMDHPNTTEFPPNELQKGIPQVVDEVKMDAGAVADALLGGEQ